MSYGIRALALVALAVAAARCGSHVASTQLRIEVSGSSGTRSYRLECGPPAGTVPNPATICRELGRQPNLLVGGHGFDHSCPSADYQAFRVSGTYRGYPIDATFPPPTCGWVPGQAGAPAEWSYLMDHAGPGVAEHELGSAALSADARAHRRTLLRRAKELWKEARRLSRQRLTALAAGRFQLVPGQPPDQFARRFFRDELEAGSLPDGPFPAEVRLYSTTRRRTGSVGGSGDLTSSPHQPVYVLIARFAYRDYTGRRLVDNERTMASVIVARTLFTTDISYGGPWSPRGLGTPTVLPL
ncbi:MAG: hypothetical protein WBB76_04065 [Gaiellaceae bacterium]